MPEYAAMYRKLFNAQTDAIEGLQAITKNLIKAQQEAEQMYIDAPEPIVVVIGQSGDKKDEDQ